MLLFYPPPVWRNVFAIKADFASLFTCILFCYQQFISQSVTLFTLYRSRLDGGFIVVTDDELELHGKNLLYITLQKRLDR